MKIREKYWTPEELSNIGQAFLDELVRELDGRALESGITSVSGRESYILGELDCLGIDWIGEDNDISQRQCDTDDYIF